MTRARIPYGAARRAIDDLENALARLTALGLVSYDTDDEFPGLRALADSASISWSFATDGAVSASVSAPLAAISGLSAADGNFVVGNGTTWVAESGATVRTSLGLGGAAVAAVCAAHADSTAPTYPLVGEYNGLLVKLRTAGLLAT